MASLSAPESAARDRSRAADLTQAPGVLFVASSPKIGGGTKVLMEVMTRLEPKFRPVLAVPGKGPLADWAERVGIPLEVVEAPHHGFASGMTTMVRYAAWLIRVIRAHGIRILHAEGPICYRPVGLAGALTGLPRICHLGFPPGPGELEWNFRFGPDLAIACYRGQMEDVRPEITRVKPHCRVSAITNGVDLARFHPRRQGEDVSEWRFGATHVVMILGHLSEVKGYPTFLRAAARIKASLGDCAFVAVGGETIRPGFKTHLMGLAAELGLADDVHFVGWQPDVAPLLRAADVVTLPSLEEGLPLAVLEAMASGVAVVATPVGGVPEAIADGLTGRLVPPEQPDALAATVIALLSNREERLAIGRAAREKAETCYSLERHAASTIETYEGLLTAARA